MDADALAQAIEDDAAAGWKPFFVAATVGTTSTTSIDPVPAIAQICRKHGLWLHIDAAYGGAAAVVPEMRYVLAGCETADSMVVNPHKWLFTPMDCSVFYVRDPLVLQRAFSLVPEYLKTGDDSVTNYMDWGVQLGRRFRALKLWMVIRYFGQDGLAAHIRSHIQVAHDLADRIDEDANFERLAPVPFSTVCFRFCPADLARLLKSAAPDDVQRIETYLDNINAALMDAVNASGRAFLSHTRLNDHYTIRLAIGNIGTTEAHVSTTWELLCQEAERLDAERRPTM
jgi:aromatic-L-amino-acid decarboxylase